MTAISGVEFLIWLLIAASTIAVLSKYLRIPYTVALVLGGLLLSLLRLPFLSPLQPDQRPHWLTPDVILILFLPALVFEGSVKIQVRDLLRDWAPLLVLANVGVLLATLVTGYLVHWAIGLPILVALMFGAIISATDPISVLAIFKDLRMNKRLSVIIEDSLAACNGLGWFARCSGSRFSTQPRQHLPLPRSDIRLDLWGRRLFHPDTGPHDEAITQGSGLG